MAVNGFNFWDLGSSEPFIGAFSYVDGLRCCIATTGPNPFQPWHFVTYTPFVANTFDFTSGTPSGPSSVDLGVSPDSRGSLPSGGADSSFKTITPLVMDANDRLWFINYGTFISDPPTLLQAYDPISGGQVSTTDIGYLATGAVGSYLQIPNSTQAVAFQWNGEAYIALFFVHTVAPADGGVDRIDIQVYNVDSGSPSDAGHVSITVDGATFSNAVNLIAFFDSVQFLYLSRVRYDGTSGAWQGIDIFQYDISSLGLTASTFVSGGYSFVGEPANQHLYVTTQDGSIVELDNSLLVVNSYPGLAAVGDSFMSNLDLNVTWPLAYPTTAYAMKNPRYGCSVDPATGQWIVAGSHITDAHGHAEGSWNRIFRFTDETVDAFTFDSWGVDAFAVGGFSSTPTVLLAAFVPMRQSFMWQNAYEFLLTPLNANPCAGVLFEFR